MGVLKRLVVLAIFANLALMAAAYGVLWGSALYGLDKAACLLTFLVLLNFPLLIIGYNLQKKRAARLVCSAGLAVFALTLVGTCWGWWFHENGVWRPWDDLRDDRVAGVELVDNLYNAGFVRALSAEDAGAAIELVGQLAVQNPCVESWGEISIPADMPPMTGEATDILRFNMRDGSWEYISVRYPYYNWSHLAADLDKAVEVESFINGLSERYR